MRVDIRLQVHVVGVVAFLQRVQCLDDEGIPPVVGEHTGGIVRRKAELLDLLRGAVLDRPDHVILGAPVLVKVGPGLSRHCLNRADLRHGV